MCIPVIKHRTFSSSVARTEKSKESHGHDKQKDARGLRETRKVSISIARQGQN